MTLILDLTIDYQPQKPQNALPKESEMRTMTRDICER